MISQDDLILQRRIWKGNGQSVVFASGCFDLLHPGHTRFLDRARSYGDVLVVAVQSDASVRAANAPPAANASGSAFPRPVTPAAERTEILAALAAVDYVVEFDGSSPDALIARLAPDTVAQGAAPNPDGSDPQPPAQQSHAGSGGGPRRVNILLEPGYSGEQLLERIAPRPA